MRNPIHLAALAALMLLLPASADAGDSTIRMVTPADNGAHAFEPDRLTLKAGDTVTWVNAQDDTHNVMSESVPEGAEPFTSPMLEKKGDTWSYTFTRPGTYSFHCHPHADLGMRGTIIVDHPSDSVEVLETGHHHEHSSYDESPAPVSDPSHQNVYICPMHPQILSDAPGRCPICGMDLVQRSSSGSPPVPVHEEKGERRRDPSLQGSSGRQVLYWYDPMVPGKRFDKPGKSPFMDMQLVPKYADEVSQERDGEKPVIPISADTVQKMGVRTERVSRGAFAQSLRATGIVRENDRTRRDLVSQVEGRIEDLAYSTAGDRVKKGDLFYTLYSPDLLSLQNDYIAARRSGLNDLAQAAKQRLTLLGVDDRVVDEIARSGKALDKVPFYIPADGILARVDIRNGSYLEPNSEIGRLQDLSSVWIEAAVPEKDIASLKEGDTVSIVPTGAGPTYEGKIDYISPTIETETRTGKVRMTVDNREEALRPGAYATVRFATRGALGVLTVPNEAILRNSQGGHVIVALGDGKFQSRTVETGIVSGGRTEIVSGLGENETIVTSAQFLIDSESSLQESLGRLSGEE